MKSVDDNQFISTIRAAEALGVSVSTVKRWVDENILPAQKTAGGHRKLLRAEVLGLARQGELPYRDLSGLIGVASDLQPPDLPSISAALLAAVLRGEETEAGSLLRRAYHSAVAVEALADQVIAPAMAQVGERWESNRIDVWEEHRATQRCAAAVFDLKDDLAVRAERNRPIAIGCAGGRPLPAGDAACPGCVAGRGLGSRQPGAEHSDAEPRESDS